MRPQNKTNGRQDNTKTIGADFSKFTLPATKEGDAHCRAASNGLERRTALTQKKGIAVGAPTVDEHWTGFYFNFRPVSFLAPIFSTQKTVFAA